jgi:hypothetical protein
MNFSVKHFYFDQLVALAAFLKNCMARYSDAALRGKKYGQNEIQIAFVSANAASMPARMSSQIGGR